MQIRYHSYILNNFNEEISQLLEKISFDDLKHQELLAHAIQMTSGNPIYCNSEGKWMGGRQIDYFKDIKRILTINFELKEKTIIDYKLAISKIENEQIKNLLFTILEDEENHRTAIKSIMKKIT